MPCPQVITPYPAGSVTSYCTFVHFVTAVEVRNRLAVEDKEGWQKHSMQSVLESARNTVVVVSQSQPVSITLHDVYIIVIVT